MRVVPLLLPVTFFVFLFFSLPTIAIFLFTHTHFARSTVVPTAAVDGREGFASYAKTTFCIMANGGAPSGAMPVDRETIRTSPLALLLC
jgi:hypothetical protein